MKVLSRTIRRLVQVAAISAAVAAAVISAMVAFNVIVFSQGQAGVKATLQRAIDDGTINATRPLAPIFYVPGGRKATWSLFAHDCLIWTTLIGPGMDTKVLSLRTIRLEAAKTEIDPRAPSNPDCQAILQVLTATQTQPTPVPYDRYIMGQRAIAQLLLGNLSLWVSSVIVHCIVYALFILALALAWYRRVTGIVAISATVLLFYGLSYYGGMLYFAPMDATHAVFIIAALLMPLGAATVVSCSILGALYGAFVAQFEILTGGIPVALALIALVVGCTLPDRRAFARNVSVIVAAFCMSFVICFAVRLSIVSLIDGSNQFARFAPDLLHRLRGDVLLETPPDLAKEFKSYIEYPLGQIVYLIHIYRPWSRMVGWGSSTTGSLLVIAGLVSLVVATVRIALRSEPGGRLPPQLLGCWLALGFLIAWIAAFWNHTLVHPFFMARFLVIPIMCGAVALVTLRDARRRRAMAVTVPG